MSRLGRSVLGVLALVAGLLSVPVVAHHSVGGQFDVSKTVVLEGTVVKVEWANPHIYIHLQVKEASGEQVIWRLGTVPVGMARQAGVTKENLLAGGLPVKVFTYPPRDGTKHLGWVYRIDYPDGKSITVAPDRQ